jgi:hypothetical protein
VVVADGSTVAPMWPGGQADVDDRASARNLVAVSLQLTLRIRDVSHIAAMSVRSRFALLAA